MSDLFPSVLSPWDADPYPFVFQRFSIPIGIVTPVRQEPFCLWQIPQKGGSAHVVADVAWRHEELQRPALGVGQGVELGVQATFRAPDGPPAPPFFTARLEAVRWAFK